MTTMSENMGRLLQRVAEGGLPQGNTRTIEAALDLFWLECIDGVWRVSDAGQAALAGG